MSELQLFWLLLPIAAASGWVLARHSSTLSSSKTVTLWQKLTNVHSLNWDRSDPAFDVFERIIEAGAGSVETHFAVANYFRRRGEVDRAIVIHRELIKNNDLSVEQRHLATLELGLDYMRSGLLDRAEQFFKDVAVSDTCSEPALTQLIDIYQQEQDWESAIACSEELQQRCGTDTHRVTAQFLCERAEQLLEQQAEESALPLLQRALQVDPRCVRVSFIEGQLALRRGDYDRALAAYLRVETQDNEFVGLALPLMLQCYRNLDRLEEFKHYLTTISRRQVGGAPSLLLAEVLAEHDGDAHAVDYLTKQLTQCPSLIGIEQLLAYLQPHIGADLVLPLTVCLEATRALSRAESGYQCRACGFETKSLYWQCPGCKHWSTVKPRLALEGHTVR